jgi:hypothetical protein
MTPARIRPAFRPRIGPEIRPIRGRVPGRISGPIGGPIRGQKGEPAIDCGPPRALPGRAPEPAVGLLLASVGEAAITWSVSDTLAFVGEARNAGQAHPPGAVPRCLQLGLPGGVRLSSCVEQVRWGCSSALGSPVGAPVTHRPTLSSAEPPAAAFSFGSCRTGRGSRAACPARAGASADPGRRRRTPSASRPGT